MKYSRGKMKGRSLPKRRDPMKNITEAETRLRKYPTDKKRLEQERQHYDDARAMTQRVRNFFFMIINIKTDILHAAERITR